MMYLLFCVRTYISSQLKLVETTEKIEYFIFQISKKKNKFQKEYELAIQEWHWGPVSFIPL